MKLNCTVQLHDKELCYSTKWQRSVLSLEKKVDSYKKEAYLLWKTEKKNQVKYLIRTKDLCDSRKNLESINLRYLNSKKRHLKNVTICFENPSHKLVIQSTDDASLNKFSKLVCMMSVGWWYSFYKLSSIKCNFTLRNTKIVGRKRKYPPKEGFPRTTKELILRKLNITELDLQSILNLHSLKVLNLSKNQILFLPKELGTLPNLEKLFLSHNCFGNTCVEINKWEWMEQTSISQSLKELNLSNNNLIELPLQIGKLQSLICLNVSQNLLTKVPQIIGTLQHLARLDLSTNLLLYLPGSMRGMELDYLDAANNPFKDLRVDEYRSPTLKVVNLVDLAAKAVKKYRISYNNLPSALAGYLDNDKFCCICRNSCFHSDIKDFRPLLDTISLPRVCQSSTLATDSAILFKCYFCSLKCYDYFCKSHKVTI